MSSTRILVAEHWGAYRLVQPLLTEQGYTVQSAVSGQAMLQLAALALPDVVILNEGVPDAGALKLCDAVREWSRTPIIVLAVDPDPHRKIELLDHGADACLVKPWEPDELLAHIRAVLRRAPTDEPAPTLECGPLRLDQVNRRVTLGRHEVHLTPTEYAILRELLHLRRNAQQ